MYFVIFQPFSNSSSLKSRVDKTIPIPAKACCILSNGTIEWKTSNVIDYLEESNTFLVKWNDIGETRWLHRQ